MQIQPNKRWSSVSFIYAENFKADISLYFIWRLQIELGTDARQYGIFDFTLLIAFMPLASFIGSKDY